jgi:hypothetical protein
LDVLEWDAGVAEAGGECVAEAVGAELAGGFEAGGAGEASDESPGLGFVHAAAVVVEEQWSGGAVGEVGGKGAFDGWREGFEGVASALREMRRTRCPCWWPRCSTSRESASSTRRPL